MWVIHRLDCGAYSVARNVTEVEKRNRSRLLIFYPNFFSKATVTFLIYCTEIFLRCDITVDACVMQMTSRKELMADRDMQLQLDLDEEKKAEDDYDEMLRKEAERMSVCDFQPKVCQL